MIKDRPIMISITPGTVAMAILMGIGFWFAFMLRELFLVMLTSVVFASAIEPITKWFMKTGIPRVISVLLIYLITTLTLVLFFYFFLPPLVNEATDFFKTLPVYMEVLEGGASTAIVDNASLAEQIMQLQDVLKSSSVGILTVANNIFGGILSFILIVVLSFYISVQERGLEDFLCLVTPVQHHAYLVDLWDRAQKKIGRWLQGQLLLSLLVGVMVYVGLLLLHVKYALLLAIVAAVLELIPVFGSILAAIPAVAVAFIESGTTLSLLVIVVYVVINQLQGNIIYPLVVQKVLGVPPLVIILAIVAGAQLAGFLGILIAVPIAAAAQELVNDIRRGKQRAICSYEEVSVS